MDFTTRLLLNKPNPDPVTGDFVDVTKLNENSDTIDAAISFTVCTSAARPAVPFQGQAILETDTGKTYIWGGSAWLPLLVGNSPQVVTNLGIGTAADANGLRKLTLYSSGTNGSLSQVLLRQSGSATASRALSTMGGTDTQDHFWIDFDGKMQWGPGTSGGDVTLSRSAAGTLDVSGSLTVGGIVPGNTAVQSIVTSGTWTKPTGAKRVWVRMVGGGGAGGGAQTSVAGAHSKGGGGGGGEYAERWFDASTLATDETVTIGAGGTGTTGNGGAGGATSFGSLLSANGGGGGFMNTSSSASWGQTGGTGGSGGTGTADFRSGGQGGSFGWGDGPLAAGGAGGSSILGGGGNGKASGSTIYSGQGADALGYGGGGGGALVNTTGASVRGGHGKAGIVIVTTFF